MRTGRWPWGAASLVALVACGDIWGFHDLVPAPPAELVFDATAGNPPDVTQETSLAVEGDASEAEAVDSASDDGAAAATLDATAADASVDDAELDARVEAGPPNDGAADAIAACQAICAGCCDSTGHCEDGDQTTVCGTGGALCQSCPSGSCIITTTACCKSVASGGGTCGCSVVLTGSLTCN
jgi:hypothetical protein